MIQLDMRTVLLCHVLSTGICAAVMTSLWMVNRERSEGLGFWLADYVMQFLAVILIVLRGILPVQVSIISGIPLVLTGTVLLYWGLERYTGHTSRRRYNYLLLTVCIGVHAYFAFVQPSLLARNISFAVALLAICLQCAWLMLRRVDCRVWRESRLVGVVFGAYSLFSLARVGLDLTFPPSAELFTSHTHDVLVVLMYQMLFISLTFSLFLMVNGRLFRTLELDIAERKLGEQALRESEEKFVLAFRISPDPLVITRMADCRFVEVNEAFHAIFGLTREEVAGGTSLELSLWADEEGHARVAKRLLNGEKVIGEEFLFRRSDGQTVTGLLSSEVLVLKNEKYVLSSIRDITERKRAEEALKQHRDKLARSNAELERFAYVASHDLQEPLRVVARFTQLLSERYSGKLDEAANSYLHFIEDGAARMQELIRDLLEYSRVDSNGIALRRTECDAVVRSAVQNLRAAIEESGAVVEVNPLPVLMADPLQLVQIFQNLVGNAIKFRGQAGPRIHIAAAEDGTGWRFSVRDNGIGIDPRQSDRVFQVFQRLHTRAEYPGTGIGLAVCKKVVERHGGRIWVESQPGQGSIFCFTLPKGQTNGDANGNTV